MEAGLWTGQGYSTPWMYHDVAGQYTLLEKQLDSDVSPCRLRPASRVLQDSTNWHGAQPLPTCWGRLKQESRWFLGKESSQGASSPKAQRQPQSLTRSRLTLWRDKSWGARQVSKNSIWYPEVPLAHRKSDLPARAPPSYEAHMLLRLRAGQGHRKENWPHPPPYVAPPSYEAPHCTVRPPQPPQRQGYKEASSARKQVLREAQPRAAGAHESLTRSPGRKAGRGLAKIPGSWSYLSGASTWSDPRAEEGEKEGEETSYGLLANWDMSPQHRSHTLPRRRKLTPGVPVSPLPQNTLPAGWGFSHATGGPQAAAGKGSRVGERPRKELPPQWKVSGRGRKSVGIPEAPWGGAPFKRGGLFVIDATRVVIQAHYIPPPRMERICYLDQEERPEKARVSTSPHGSPRPASMEERATRILGLSLSELGLSGAGVGQIQGPKAGEGHATEAHISGEAYGTGQPGGAHSAPASPRKPLLAAPALSNFRVRPAEQEEPCHGVRGTTVPCLEDGCGRLQGGDEPPLPTAGASYALHLKEAMLRIRRHTAPDSDSDDGEEELDKDVRCEPSVRRGWLLDEGALSYSSSSLDSSSSNATVVLMHPSPSLKNGPKAAPQSTAREGRSVQDVP